MTQPGMPDFRQMQPDQILRALSPILEMAVQSAERGAPLTAVIRDAVTAAFLAGNGVAPNQAVLMVQQLRRAAIGRELTPPATRPGLPPMPGPGMQQPVRQGFQPGMQTPMTANGMPEGAGGHGPMLQELPTAEQPPETPSGEMEQPEASQPGIRPPMPGMPPGGAPNHAGLVNAIRQTMGDEASDAIFYTRLMEQISEPALRDYVRHARDDELKHYRILGQLHQSLTGQPYEAEAHPTEFATLRAGLKKAMDGEYEGFERYRTLALRYQAVPQAYDVFFELLTDELEHVTRFNYVLQSLPADRTR